MKVTDFSGTKCGNRYQKDFHDKFRDCVSFYIDGKLKFERFCYGEGACLVYGVWGTMKEDGTIVYKQPFDSAVEPEALPKQITKIEDDGETLYFDENWKKWIVKAELTSDKLNGYTPFKCLIKRMLKK